MLACSREPKAGGGDTGESGSSGASTTPRSNAAEAACEPRALGLGDAKPVTIWKAPAGCTPKVSAGAPILVRSDAEFSAQYTCTGGAGAGVDFATQALVLSARSLPPAGVGTSIVDDGAKVTFISRQRSPCPSDPRPMPVSVVYGFVLPAGAARTFGDSMCSVPSKCN
jgi:hypothetical protein